MYAYIFICISSLLYCLFGIFRFAYHRQYTRFFLSIRPFRFISFRCRSSPAMEDPSTIPDVTFAFVQMNNYVSAPSKVPGEGGLFFVFALRKELSVGERACSSTVCATHDAKRSRISTPGPRKSEEIKRSYPPSRAVQSVRGVCQLSFANHAPNPYALKSETINKY